MRADRRSPPIAARRVRAIRRAEAARYGAL